ncbi:hypothetical protein I9Y31_002907 [Clostridium perfringens]|nr:hypothetical protein [Clostridium perfringens]
MSNWSSFEEECTDFLNTKYSNSSLFFKHVGGSNSNISDIQIIKDNSIKGYIEAKMSLAQSGQFVLLKNDTDSAFIYSPLNKSPLTPSAQIIINYINSNYNNFKDVNTNSLGINLPSNIFTDWITQHYLDKGALFIITSSFNGKLIVFKTEDFGKYFTIKANFRRKKSGSSNLPTSHYDSVFNYLNTIFNSKNIKTDFLKSESTKKYYINLNTDTSFDKYQFTINNVSYQLSAKQNSNYNNLYEIRKLGSTNNPNVIFSIEYNGTTSSINQLEDYLHSLL